MADFLSQFWFAPRISAFGFALSMAKRRLNRIKVVLVEKDKKINWLANQINKSTNTVSLWCNNQRQPSLENLYAIAKLLEVDIYDLLVSVNEVTEK